MQEKEPAQSVPGPLVLEPLTVEHASEMSWVLAEPALYTFTGGAPPTVAELEARYAAQVAGSPDGSQLWLNWVVRRRDAGRAIGFVQATVTDGLDQRDAELAWVIGVQDQGRGFAREAVHMMLLLLRGLDVATVRAHIHPEHHASNAVARAVGLSPTGRLVDGEMCWQRHLGASSPSD